MKEQTLHQNFIYISFYIGTWKLILFPVKNIFKGIKTSQVVQLLHPFSYIDNYFDFDDYQVNQVYNC